MVPAPDFTFGGRASAEFSQFDMPLHFAIGAFVPFFSPFVGDVLHRFGGAAAHLAASPFVTDPVSQLFPILGGGSGNLLLQAAVLALPILACFIIVRDALRTAEFALTYFGVLLFVQLWQFPGGLRHYGILFVAFVGTVWMWRSPCRRAARHRRYGSRCSSSTLSAVLRRSPGRFAPTRKAAMPRPGSRPCTSKTSSSWARLTGPRRRSQAICSDPSIISTVNASAPTWCGTKRGQISLEETRWSAAPSKP